MRVSFFLRSVLLSLSAAACLTAQSKASEMLYYFSFDDSTNTNLVTGSVAGTVGTANTTFSPGTGKWNSTSLKKAAGNAYALELTNITNVNFSDSFSLSLHIKDEGTANWKDYLQIGNNDHSLKMELVDQSGNFTLYDKGMPLIKPNDNMGTLTKDWCHLVISFSNNKVTVYVNGKAVEATVDTANVDPATLGAVNLIRLGGANTDGLRVALASFDDVAFYKGALTVEQVSLLGLYAANDPVQTGGLASKDGTYTYRTDTMSLGASVEGMVLSQLISFDQGVSQSYRFTTADAPSNLGGAVAHSFTVGSLLSDGASPRGIVLIGQDNAENRTLTVTNDGNTFTGDVTIQKSTLKAQSGGNVTKSTAVTLLGSGNKIVLQSKGTLDLATGTAAYLYSNGLSFAQAGGKIVQTKGTHTLTSDISLAADGTIENASATALNLTGKILETASSTLTLKTLADANSTLALTGGSLKLSGLNLTGNISSQGGTMEVSTLTLNGSSKLALAQTELVLGSGGVKTDTAGGGSIQLDRESSLRASADFSSAAGVTWKLEGNTPFELNTDAYNVNIGGQVTGQDTTLAKTGTGTLTLSQTVSGISTVNLSAGGLAFGSANALSGIKTLNLSNNTSLNLGGFVGKAGQTVNVARNIQLQGAAAYTGTVIMQSQASRLNVSGDFKAERITFQLGLGNTSNGGDTPLVKLDGKAAITGTTEGSIILNFDEEYLHMPTAEGNTFQLFSSGLTYVKGSIQNNQKQLITVDDTKLKTDGSIILRAASLSANLVTQEDIAHWTQYEPDSNSTYLGADGGTVIIGSGIPYIVGELPAYKMTPGTGTLVYQGSLSGEKALYVLDYASIEKEAEHSTGSVVITHNGNTFTEGTNVNGTTLVVDLSQGTDTGLAAQAQNGNLNVSALGSGNVVGVVGTHGSAVIVLQSYGNQALEGVNTFTYANDFDLSGGSVLKQAGANAQILTGNLTFGAGANMLVNEGSKSLTIKGNITQTTQDALTLKSGSIEGKIVLDGAGTLTSNKLTLIGAGRTEVTNGYNVKVWGMTVDEGTLVVQKNSTLTLGKEGLSGSGTFVLDGGTVSSSSSWNSSVTITLGMGANTINTGGANVRLNNGVTGEGGFIKQGSGFLYIQDNGDQNARGLIDVKQGRLILLGAEQKQARDIATATATAEYKLNGDLTLSSGKGASLSGMIDANGKNVTFGNKTNFYLSVGEESGLTGYIRNADTLTFGEGTQLHVDVLGDNWLTDKTYTIFSAANPIQGASNLELTMEEDFAFVNIALDKNTANEIGITLTQKTGNTGGSVYAPTNAGAISSVVTPLVNDVLAGNSELTGKLLKTMQTVSKMTTSEYDTYLSGMGASASSFYTALSAQVQDVTQHVNSVRNRVELLSPVMYDDWNKGGIYNVWAGGINHYRDVKSDFQSPGYEMTSWGGELGCAIPLSESFMMGVGFAYTFTDVQVKDGWGNNESDTYNVDFFARYRKDALTITGVLTGGFTNAEFHRNQLVKNEFTTSNSSTDGNQFMGTLEAGYDFYLNDEKSWILQPLVNLTAGRAKLDGLRETGDLKNAGLMIGSQSYNMFSAGIGAKIAYQYKNAVSDQPGRVELKAMYVNDMGDVDFKVNGRFIGAPEREFNLNGVSNERSAAIVSAGWIAPISAYGQFFVDAGCEFRKDQNGVNSTVGFSFQF